MFTIFGDIYETVLRSQRFDNSCTHWSRSTRARLRPTARPGRHVAATRARARALTQPSPIVATGSRAVLSPTGDQPGKVADQPSKKEGADTRASAQRIGVTPFPTQASLTTLFLVRIF